MTTTTIIWNRLDTPGHDACALSESAGGWKLDGCAVFVSDGVPARLSYQLTCDSDWLTQRGTVSGFIGLDAIAFEIERTAQGIWLNNGNTISGLDGCVDLDLGFSPATNLTQLRRLALSEGQGADAPVAWLDLASGALQMLRQRYERRSASAYWYEAPRFDYAAVLEVREVGFVRKYPGLWAEQAFAG